MHDAFVMRKLQRLADLRHDRQSLVRWQATTVHQLPQICPIHIFHQKVKDWSRPRCRSAIVRHDLTKIMHRHNMRMTQPSQRPGFAIKSFGKRRISGGLRANDLQRDKAIQFLLPSLVNGSHAAMTKQSQNLQLRKQRSQRSRRRRNEFRRSRRSWRKKAVRADFRFRQRKRRSQQARRAKSGRSVFRQVFSTLRAEFRSSHRGNLFTGMMGSEEDLRNPRQRLHGFLAISTESRFRLKTWCVRTRNLSSYAYF